MNRMDFNVKRMPWMEKEKILNTKAMKEEILVKYNNEAGRQRIHIQQFISVSDR